MLYYSIDVFIKEQSLLEDYWRILERQFFIYIYLALNDEAKKEEVGGNVLKRGSIGHT